MKGRIMPLLKLFIFNLICVLVSTCYSQADQKGLDQDGVAHALGKQGTAVGEIYKVSFPRTDLRVKAGAVLVKPEFALTSWAAFKKTGESAIAYGDLVLLESELNSVISQLEKKGIVVSAIHNHLIYETPRIIYLHFAGYGNEVALSAGLKTALAVTGTPLKSTGATPETKTEMVKKIENILGYEGSMAGGILHVNITRNDIRVKMMGTEIPGSMGMNTSLNFQIDAEKIAISGDFLLLSDEVNPVIKALRDNGIEIASLHNHTLDDEPRVFFMHFWAYGDSVSLAKGLKAALDKTGIKK